MHYDLCIFSKNKKHKIRISFFFLLWISMNTTTFSIYPITCASVYLNANIIQSDYDISYSQSNKPLFIFLYEFLTFLREELSWTISKRLLIIITSLLYIYTDFNFVQDIPWDEKIISFLYHQSSFIRHTEYSLWTRLLLMYLRHSRRMTFIFSWLIL